MLRIILIAVALFQVPQSINRQINIVFVTPQNETFTTAEQQQALTSVRNATDWWTALSPIPTSLPIGVVSSIAVTTTDPINDFSWVKTRVVANDPNITIYVIDNSESRKLLFGDSAGEAQEYYGVVVAVLYGLPGPQGLEETITHELGHAVYHLDDLSFTAWDIMGNTAGAYQSRFIGCASLAALGAPCQRAYLPYIGK